MNEPAFLTPSWRGDLGHFRLQRKTLAHFGLDDSPHHVVVQTEDMELFRPLETGGVVLHATADVLPPSVEAGRQDCLRRSAGGNRHIARLRRSANKRFGWFPWVRYYGWQIQQITKLAAPVALDLDVTVVLDSDTLICGPVNLAQTTVDQQTIHIRSPQIINTETPGISHRWLATAHRLLDIPHHDTNLSNGRLGTPVVFDKATLSALMRKLGPHWYDKLLSLPPASWSEFALYNTYAEHFARNQLAPMDNSPFWRVSVLADDDQRHQATTLIRQAFADPDYRFLTIQSDARDQAKWKGDDFSAIVEDVMSQGLGLTNPQSV